MEEDKKPQTIEEAIDETYNKLLDLICDRHDSLYELKMFIKKILQARQLYEAGETETVVYRKTN